MRSLHIEYHCVFSDFIIDFYYFRHDMMSKIARVESNTICYDNYFLTEGTTIRIPETA
jgi:hypothetical protein